ncbi:enoyl-CoA hydratase [Mycobacterium sp. SM3041]|uniref:enoyl-CoA hydratase n=1 Tax=Mycobacterium sp. SM3041 TaxID=3114291 RepID=UPI003204E13A
MAEESDVLVVHENSVAWIKINRAERLNALTTRTLDTATGAVVRAAADPAVRAIAITGVGRAFSAGADIVGSNSQSGGPDSTTIDAANRLIRALRGAPKPVLAAVNGPAVGVGCSIALAADLVIARESSYFLLAFANIGLMPDGGATALIPSLIGLSRANRMAMLAERIAATTAAEWGLISHSVPDHEFDTAAAQLARKLAEGPTQAYTKIKAAFNATALAGLDLALQIERNGQLALFTTDDFTEGVAAFQQKRRPVFTGT